MEFRSGPPVPSDGTLGFRAGYEAGFKRAARGLVLTVQSEWRSLDVSGLLGGEWQAGWRAGWVVGCEDGRLSRQGEERLN